MRSEQPQKGNPHNITVNQHVLPKASIERFSNNDGFVQIFYHRNQKVFKKKPDDKIFCAYRHWDQRAESGYMKIIEDKYQRLAESVKEGRTTTIGPLESWIIDDFFALWRTRSELLINPIADAPIKGPGLTKETLTQNQQELLESGLSGYITNDMKIPGRQIAGIQGQMATMHFADCWRSGKWGILHAGEGEFVVPDLFPALRILPLTPKICLIKDFPNALVSSNVVAYLNQNIILQSYNLCFARDFSSVPLLDSTSSPQKTDMRTKKMRLSDEVENPSMLQYL